MTDWVSGPGASPNPKDALEVALKALVCRGRLSLADAQLLIATDWVLAFRRYVPAGSSGSRR